MGPRRTIIFVKCVIYIICTGLFIFLMKEVWKKYQDKTTITSIEQRIEPNKAKVLPCLTVHAHSSFKERGFYYTEKGFFTLNQGCPDSMWGV